MIDFMAHFLSFQAGMDGGNNNIHIELEPEGASIACRDDLLPVWRSFGRPDIFRYMVVDCGGGTVDITIHDLDMNTKKIKEVHHANGGPWGGTNVDDEIDKLVRKAVGERLITKLDHNDLYHLKRTHIEEAKRKVRDNRSTVTLKLPLGLAQLLDANGGVLTDTAGIKYRNGRLKITVDSLAACFKKSLDRTTEHIRTKMTEISGVKCLMFVGGYSESPLLLRRMQQEFDTDACRVIRPESASLSVVKGAVLYGINPNVIVARCAKYTYGTEETPDFDPSIHPTSRLIIRDGKEFCDGVFSLLINKGKPARLGHKYEKRFHPIAANQTDIFFPLYRSDKVDPKFVDEGVRLDSMTLEIPNTEKGLDRRAVFEWDFSRTEIHCTAYDVDNPAVRKEMKVGFHHQKPSTSTTNV